MASHSKSQLGMNFLNEYNKQLATHHNIHDHNAVILATYTEGIDNKTDKTKRYRKCLVKLPQPVSADLDDITKDENRSSHRTIHELRYDM